MKYINKKVIKGKAYYYLQYKNYSKNLGIDLPEDLSERLFEFFGEISEKEYEKLDVKIKHEFRFGDLKALETQHFQFIAFDHDLLKEAQNRFYSEFPRLFTYHSNRSEGSKTTKKEIDDFAERKNKQIKTKTEREIFNSFLAFKHAISNDMRWSLKHIKQIHGFLLDGLDPLIAGKWKNEQNVAPGNQPTAKPKDVQEAMKKLLEWLKNEFRKNTYPPKLALQFYVRFEQIHPFLDGNGRTGRILLNAILHKFNYPPVVFFSENHQSHNAAITEAIEGRWTKMNKHFMEQEKKTTTAILKKIIDRHVL